MCDEIVYPFPDFNGEVVDYYYYYDDDNGDDDDDDDDDADNDCDDEFIKMNK